MPLGRIGTTMRWINLANAPPAPTSTSSPAPSVLPMLDPLLPYVPAAVLVVAIVAAFIAGMNLGAVRANRRIASENLEIARRKEERSIPNLVLECLDGLEPTSSAPDRLLAFDCRIGNPSDAPNSIVQISLRVSYSVDDASSTFEMPSSRAPSTHFSPIDLPHKLLGGESTRGWVVFVLPAAMTLGWAGVRLDLIAEDVHGLKSEIRDPLVRRVP